MKNNPKLTFSGHDTFHCRNLWLKKGYDFVLEGNLFSSEDAVVKLGVGRNMVNSIRYWMRCFGITDSADQLMPLSHKLFDNEKGWDPYLEDDGSLWILHYNLIKSNIATIYSAVFNELRRDKIEFSKPNVLSFLNRKILEAEKNQTFNANTLAEDFTVLVKTYLRSDNSSKDKEEKYVGLLTELDLMKSFFREKDEYYVIENTERDDLPVEILLFALLDNPNYGNSVSLNNLENDTDGIGSIFAINKTGIVAKIDELLETKHGSNLNFRDHAGIKELQFKKKPTPFSVLNSYYAN